MAPRSSVKRGRLPPHIAPATALVLALLPLTVTALEALDDDSMAAVQAQDGLTLTLDNNRPQGITTTAFNWITDPSISNREATTTLAPSLRGDGDSLHAVATLDVGSANPTGIPMAALNLNWNPLLLESGNWTLKTPTNDYASSGSSFGQFGIYSQGHLNLSNQGGPFNNGGNTARLDFASSGDIIYRQGTPELSFGNFTLATKFSTGAAAGQAAGAGKLGIDNDGLVISAPYTDTTLRFDIQFKGAPASSFDRNGRQGLLRFGWLGGLVNPLMRVNSGGVGYGSYTSTTQRPGDSTSYTFQSDTSTRSGGLNILAQWDFDSDFSLVLGQISGSNEVEARFSKWRRMATVPASTPMLSMPVTLDVVQNGTGPTGLCFGGGFGSGMPVQSSCSSAGGSWISGGVPIGKSALAALIRDGHLHAYNQKIEIVDPLSATPHSAYDWSLIFTMGKLDADMFFYPEGRAPGVTLATNNIGIKADITLAIQSPGFWDQANSSNATVRNALYSTGAGTRWATNSHFMIGDPAVGGDSNKQYGLGLANADLLWSVRNMYFRLVSSDSGYPLLPGGFWLQTDSGASYRLRGLFGGGNLQDLSRPTGLFLMDMNLSTNRFIFDLYPRPPVGNDVPLGFAGLLDLDGSSYLSLGEVSSPTTAYRIYDMQGRIAWRDGSLNVVSGQNAADGLPRIALSNDLLFGSSARFSNCTGSCNNIDTGGAPLVAKVGFGSESFGRIALPGGTWHSDVSLRIPSN